MKKFVATGLAIAMMLTTSVSAVDGKAVDERDRIESAPATRVGVSTRVGMGTRSHRRLGLGRAFLSICQRNR